MKFTMTEEKEIRGAVGFGEVQSIYEETFAGPGHSTLARLVWYDGLWFSRAGGGEWELYEAENRRLVGAILPPGDLAR